MIIAHDRCRLLFCWKFRKWFLLYFIVTYSGHFTRKSVGNFNEQEQTSVTGIKLVLGPFAASAVACPTSQLRTSSEMKLSLAATRQLWSKLLFFMSSLCQTHSSLCLFFVLPTEHIRKSKPGACLRCNL